MSVQASPTVIPAATPRRHSALAQIGREALLLIVASVFLALTARISIPLPFTPVPISGQTLGVLLIGALYGPRRGAAAVVVYLLEGLAGAPVFAGGRSGLAVLLGPTGGYLMGFVPAAAITGLACASARPAWLRLAGALVASLVVYAIGVPWLSVVTGSTLPVAISGGAVPFLPGDILKSALAAGVVPAGALLLRRLGIWPR